MHDVSIKSWQYYVNEDFRSVFSAPTFWSQYKREFTNEECYLI